MEQIASRRAHSIAGQQTVDFGYLLEAHAPIEKGAASL